MQKQLLESIPQEGLSYGTHINVEVSYNKGGVSYFTGRTVRRGYYLSVQPVKRERGMVSFELYSAHTLLLMEASRYSVKQFEKAVQMGREQAPALIQKVLQEQKSA